MPNIIFEDQDFRGGSIKLDGNAFRRCTFDDDVILQYDGGPVEIGGCRFNNVVWQFGGDFGRGLAVFRDLYAGNRSAALAVISDVMFGTKQGRAPN